MNEGALFLVPLLYLLLVLAAVATVVIALWRIMKAQEATAEALQQIAHSFVAERPGAPR